MLTPHPGHLCTPPTRPPHPGHGVRSEELVPLLRDVFISCSLLGLFCSSVFQHEELPYLFDMFNVLPFLMRHNAPSSTPKFLTFMRCVWLSIRYILWIGICIKKLRLSTRECSTMSVVLHCTYILLPFKIVLIQNQRL